MPQIQIPSDMPRGGRNNEIKFMKTSRGMKSDAKRVSMKTINIRSKEKYSKSISNFMDD